MFSLRQGLWLSRFNAIVLLLIVAAMYGWQYGWLVLNQDRLDMARRRLDDHRFELLKLEDRLFEAKKHLQTLQKAEETHRAIQLLTGERSSTEDVVRLSDIILRQSKLYGYDPLLIVAIIQVESRFRTEARGRYRSGRYSGARGLMQIKPSTAESVANRLGLKFTPQDLMDEETNVFWGTAYLTRLLLHFGDIRTAIIAYNMGIGSVQSKLSRGEILPKRYYHKVMDRYSQLKEEIRG
jgi:hypothetical protein